MKTFLLWSVMLSLIVGCASPNPNFNPAQPPSDSNPALVPNKTLTGITDTAHQVAPLVPSPYGTLLDIGAVIAGLVGVGVAKWQNSQKNAAQATTSQLAASVAAQPAPVAQAILDHASYNEAVYPSVADAVNKKTVA